MENHDIQKQLDELIGDLTEEDIKDISQFLKGIERKKAFEGYCGKSGKKTCAYCGSKNIEKLENEKPYYYCNKCNDSFFL
jgi:formamidopyrimidine-DNA glycosylase